jgi:hypothetical protein
MPKTIVTRYGTKINVDGLTPEQIAKVRQTAEGKGAYGKKGAALASTFQKQNAKATPAAPTTGTPGAPTSQAPSLGINAGSGDVNPTVAGQTIYDSSLKDTDTSFNLNNPGSQTNASGATQTVTKDPVTGKVTINQTGGAAYDAASAAFTGATNNLGPDGRNKAQDAAYGYITKTYQRDKQREMEAAKQELAQRGIPIDSGPNSLWTKTLQGIDEKYQGLDDQAKNQAIGAGNTIYATDVNAIGTLGNTLSGQNPTFTAYAGGTSDVSGDMLNALNTIAGFNMEKYKTDKAYKVQMDQVAVQRMNANRRPSGGGSSSSNSGGGIIFAGEAP